MTTWIFPRLARAGIFAAAVAMGATAAMAQSISEREAWLAAHTLGTPDAYEWFLELYPDGEHAEKAKQALAGELAPRFPELTAAAQEQTQAAKPAEAGTQAAEPPGTASGAGVDRPASETPAEITAPEAAETSAPALAEAPAPPRKPDASAQATDVADVAAAAPSTPAEHGDTPADTPNAPAVAEAPAPAAAEDTQQAALPPETAALPQDTTTLPPETAALPSGTTGPAETGLMEIAPPPLDRARLRELVDSAFGGRPISGLSYERLSYLAYMLGQTAGLRTEADARLAAVTLANALAGQVNRLGGLSASKRERLAEAVAAGLTRSVQEDAIPVGEGVLLAAARGGLDAGSVDLRPAGGLAIAPGAAPARTADARDGAQDGERRGGSRTGIQIEEMAAVDPNAPAPGTGNAAAQARTGADRRQGEINAWQWARQMGTPEAYRHFLAEYPESAHRGQAVTALRDLGEWAPDLGLETGNGAAEDAAVPEGTGRDRQAEEGGQLLGRFLRLFGGDGQ